jgi:hypothetical protein
MKTPREILFKRHEGMEPKLDAIRREALAVGRSQERGHETRSPISLRDCFLSLRWHLAGISAVWLLILFLRMDTGHSSSIIATVPPAKVLPPQVILTSLRENRRVLAEMIGNESQDVDNRNLFLLRPHSEVQRPTMMV